MEQIWGKFEQIFVFNLLKNASLLRKTENGIEFSLKNTAKITYSGPSKFLTVDQCKIYL